MQYTRNEVNDSLTILVNSCDAFSDVWELFFTALEVQWPDVKYMPIILNTESKQYQRRGLNIQTVNYIKKNEKDCWGRRYKHALKSVKTPYVFPILDDFVLKEAFTGREMINRITQWMNNDPSIGVFYIHKHPNVIQRRCKYDGFGQMPEKCEYKLTTGVGIWRKSFLEKCIKGIETPWEWELYSTKRAWKYREKFFALLETEEEPYQFPWGGVLWRGLWHSEAMLLAEKYGVSIDFNQRGFMDEEDPYRIGKVYSVKKHFPQDVLKKKFWQEFYLRIRHRVRKAIIEL